jgi:hypothetical protein
MTYKLPVANNILMLNFFRREMCKLHKLLIGSRRIARSERILNRGVMMSDAFWLKHLPFVINLFQIASRGWHQNIVKNVVAVYHIVFTTMMPHAP